MPASKSSPPSNQPPSEIGSDWLGFTQSVRECLVPNPDDRSLDQLIPFRDKVYRIVQDEAFLKELNERFGGWAPEDFAGAERRALVQDALREELRSFSRVLEVEKASAPAESGVEGWKKKIPSLLTKASIVNGSVKDLAGDLPYVKSGLTLMKELIDFFKGKG